MVYMGLSLFIIRRALRLYGCMRIYAYNLTLVHGCCTNERNRLSSLLESPVKKIIFKVNLTVTMKWRKEFRFCSIVQNYNLLLPPSETAK